MAFSLQPCCKNCPQRFIELLDTPHSYFNQAGKFVRVKADESGLEFVQLNISTNNILFFNTIDELKNYDTAPLNTGQLAIVKQNNTLYYLVKNGTQNTNSYKNINIASNWNGIWVNTEAIVIHIDYNNTNPIRDGLSIETAFNESDILSGIILTSEYISNLYIALYDVLDTTAININTMHSERKNIKNLFIKVNSGTSLMLNLNNLSIENAYIYNINHISSLNYSFNNCSINKLNVNIIRSDNAYFSFSNTLVNTLESDIIHARNSVNFTINEGGPFIGSGGSSTVDNTRIINSKIKYIISRTLSSTHFIFPNTQFEYENLENYNMGLPYIPPLKIFASNVLPYKYINIEPIIFAHPPFYFSNIKFKLETSEQRIKAAIDNRYYDANNGWYVLEPGETIIIPYENDRANFYSAHIYGIGFILNIYDDGSNTTKNCDVYVGNNLLQSISIASGSESFPFETFGTDIVPVSGYYIQIVNTGTTNLFFDIDIVKEWF